MKRILISLLIAAPLFSTPINIDREYILSMKEKGFDAFIAHKKRQYYLMRKVTGIPVIGSLVSWGMESIGNVKMEEAKIFLSRVFADEQAFLQSIQAFENLPQNIQFLQQTFSNVSKKTLKKRSREELVTAMRKAHHEDVPIPKKMGEKNNKGEYTINDERFFNFAACSLFALHVLDQQPQKIRRQSRRKHRYINHKRRNIHEKILS